MKIKVCGMKHNTDGVSHLGPDYLGFILWEGSPRYFSGSLPKPMPGEPIRVGVFVDAEQEYILSQCHSLQLGLIQLHGSESAQQCRELNAILTAEFSEPPGLIKAFQVGASFDFKDLQPYLESCDFFLFDSRGPMPGGNGTLFDWRLLGGYPYQKPYFLSGGIGPEAMETLRKFIKSPASRFCHAIDVNSRFETAPGKKNLGLLKEFMDSGINGPGETSKI
jgi:phosphoribosylanthranilate isomerase